MFDELEYEPELALEYEDDMPMADEGDEEYELAMELLSVADDDELELFFGKVFRGAKKFLRSNTGRALVGSLKGLAKKALPTVGTAIGTAFGGPAGAAIGRSLGSAASGLLEFEQYDEQGELENAKKIIRIAKTAAKKAVQKQDQEIDPRMLARHAISYATRRHAPNFYRQASRGGSSRRSGRWYRQGNRIILSGV